MRGDHPLLPGGFPAGLVIHLEGQIACEGRDQVDEFFRVDHVIELRNTVRGKILGIFVTCIRRADHCRACELTDCNVIRMPIIPIGRKRDNDLRHHPPNVSDNLPNRFRGIGLVHFAIDVIQKVETFHAQFMDCILQLSSTELRENAGAWIPLLRAAPALLPA
jgi:hypothetical protein